MARIWTDRLTEPQVEDLCVLYRQEWWTVRRTPDEVRRMLEHTDVFVAAIEDDRLVAFARVLTDRVFKALVFDVIVAASARSRGLGRTLMNHVCHHPLVKDVQHVELYCRPELEPFYRRLGFVPMDETLRLVRRENQAAASLSWRTS